MKAIFFILILGCLTDSFAKDTLSSLTVYLKKKLITNEKVIKLSDIATLDNNIKDRVVISDLGKPVYLTASEISARFPDLAVNHIYGNGINLIPLNGTMTKERAEKLLLEHLQKNSTINYKITCQDERTLTYPDFSNVSLEWGGLPENPNSGLRILILKFSFNNEIIHSLRIKFLFESKISAVILKRAIRRGERIRKDDFELKEVFSDANENNYVNQDITGFTAMADLEPNKIIYLKQIRNVKPVEKGSKVNLVYVNKNIIIKATANAMESGEIGEYVKIRRGSKSLSGRISGDGLVTIE